MNGYKEKKQAAEELKVESWRFEHGLGDTSFEKPITLEQNHEVEEFQVMENEIFERQIDVKGDLSSPEKFPAKEILVPTIFSKVTPLTNGSLSGSNFSSGCEPL